MDDVNFVTTLNLKCQVQGVGHTLSPHVSAKFPSGDVAAIVVEERTEIEPQHQPMIF